MVVILSESEGSAVPAPLEGILVVAIEQAVAAPLCTRRLAEAGARVIKVERPGGDFARAYDDVVHGESAYFVWLNAGKESLVLDFSVPSNAALLRRLVARADVFVQNLAPGAAARAGFDSGALRAEHPRLITCDISGYGESGPYRDLKAYDLLIQCESGLASITGDAGGPGRVGVSVADIACGLNAYSAILEALLRRARTGLGAGIAVSLFDALADWMTVPLLHYEYGGAAPARVGLSHPSIAPYGAYETGDGTQLVIAIQNDREWTQFCDGVLERPELAKDERFRTNSDRVRNRTDLDAAVGDVFRELATGETIRRLTVARTAFGRVNSVADLSSHPQLRRRTLKSASGDILAVAPPVRDTSTPTTEAIVPALDEHGAAIRAEFA
ncbi:MAG: CaiB/BaiF CoA-transferase family protein [Gemmatimonadota bacterium]